MNSRQSFRMTTRFGFAVAAALTLAVASGCRSSRKSKPGLLAPRAIVPPPYTTPAHGSGTAVALPASGAPQPTPPALSATEPSFVPLDPLPMAEPTFSPLAPLPPSLPAAAELTPPTPPSDIEPAVSLPPVVESSPLTYTVQKGDSLWTIARMYGITYQELAAENNLDPKAVLQVNKVLRIPPGGRFVPPAERPPVKPAQSDSSKTAAGRSTSRPSTTVTSSPIPSGGVYKVQSGDSLWTISRKFGVKSDDIRRWNNLSTDVLQIGQELRLVGSGGSAPAPRPAVQEPRTQPAPAAPTVTPPEPPPTAPEAMDEPENAPRMTLTPETTVAPLLPETGIVFPKKLSHTVSKDETLQTIADMYESSVDQILKENPTIKSDADLQINMKIMVPYR